ncbi:MULTISPECIES: hypothetical protein [Bradyrhizobium]|uniref:hypothetical protein n=1 Tax=Bradyrhizobium TaxID=374 RepID=UPI001FE92486|nr:hypothetical protein [Bradyrhizobium rifense]
MAWRTADIFRRTTTGGLETIRYPPKLTAPTGPNALDAANHAPAGPAAMAAGDICYNRARLEAFRGNLCLQIVRPALST